MSLIIKEKCEALAQLSEVTKGDDSMSRRHHAEEANGLIDYIAGILEAVLYPGDEDDEEPDELGLAIQEHVAAAATLAFVAGRHFQLGLGKEHEPAAISGYKYQKASERGVAKRRGKTAKHTSEVLAEMKRLITQGHSIKRAAALAAGLGKGSSEAANRQLWNRFKRR